MHEALKKLEQATQNAAAAFQKLGEATGGSGLTQDPKTGKKVELEMALRTAPASQLPMIWRTLRELEQEEEA